MTIKQTSDAVAVTGAGTFERIVSHDEALEAAKALIDGHFNNKGGRGVYISIPAQPDNTDVLLVDYIKQQRALSRLASTRPMTEDVAGLVEDFTSALRLGVEDDVTIPFDLAVRIHATLTTPAPAVKPHCSTCGKDVAEVLCETCGKWWADNLPPAPAVSRDEAIEQIVVGFSDKAILHLDIDEDDPRLSLICDEMRQTVRAILSRIRGEGE